MLSRFYSSDQSAQRAALEEVIANYATPALHTELLGHQVVVQHSKGLPWMPVTVIQAEDWLDMHAKWERVLSEASVKQCVDGAAVRDGYVAGGSTAAMTKALRCAENYRSPRGTRQS